MTLSNQMSRYKSKCIRILYNIPHYNMDLDITRLCCGSQIFTLQFYKGNYVKMAIKWLFSYTCFVKVSLVFIKELYENYNKMVIFLLFFCKMFPFEHTSLITQSISMDTKHSVIKELHCIIKTLHASFPINVTRNNLKK